MSINSIFSDHNRKFKGGRWKALSSLLGIYVKAKLEYKEHSFVIS